ncbi:MAG: hypothetical protein WBQ23_03520 [Bacteroidota bacterium]
MRKKQFRYWEIPALLPGIGAVLIIAFCSACAPGGHTPINGIAVADTALSGAWYQLENTYILGGQFEPFPFEVILIEPDGSFNAAGIHYPTGTLRQGLPRHFWLCNRKVLWSDSTAMEWLEDPPMPGMGTRAYEANWKREENKLVLDIERSSRSFSREVYSRVYLGDTITEPVLIKAEIDIDGDTLRPFQIGSRPPGRALVMQLDTATHVTMTIEGPLGTDRAVLLYLRIFDYTVPGTYPIAREAASKSDHRARTTIGITTGRQGPVLVAGAASSGTVTITSLDFHSGRCRGRVDAVFAPSAKYWPDAPPIVVGGTFDVPIYLTHEYEVHTIRATGSSGRSGIP